MDNTPDPNHVDNDSINMLEKLLATEGETQRFRAAYSKQSWDELRSATRDALIQGLAALRGLQAGESSTTSLRYVNWYHVNSRAFLQVLNQLPECLVACGGPLGSQDESAFA
jgi:hypothetical protein